MDQSANIIPSTCRDRVARAARRHRSRASDCVPAKIACSDLLVATGATRAVMDKLVAASTQALSRPHLESRVKSMISVAGSVEDMNAAARARIGLQMHGVGTGSPVDEISVVDCSQSALRWAICCSTETISDGQRALRIVQRIFCGAKMLRALQSVPANHVHARKLVNDVLATVLARLSQDDPLLPWLIARRPKAMDRLRMILLRIAAVGIFGIQYAWEKDFRPAIRLLGFLSCRKGRRPVPEASVRLLERAIEDVDLHILALPDGRQRLLPIIACEAFATDNDLRAEHAGWRRVLNAHGAIAALAA
ncbi:MAG TPA: hypothetical protein VM580_22500 [Labilithrix sp.]|nr:hypothetical protein [Labilithrix sp.]